MDRQLTTWKALADRFWSANMPDYREAAQLTAEIASASDDALRHAAMRCRACATRWRPAPTAARGIWLNAVSAWCATACTR
jgi:hypothetical protein